MKKKISIVMPFFNEEKNLLNIFNDLKKKVIDVNQQIYDFEVLLMNNNSIDNSSNIAKLILKLAMIYVLVMLRFS